jgi:signal transduction histidine kinase
VPAPVQACLASPNPADTALALELLGEHGIAARAFASLRELAYALDESMGCLIIVEEALLEEEIPSLQEALRALPAWSDVPLVLISRDVGPLGIAAARAFPSSGNVTLLERPLNPHTFLSAVQVALRAAARQRQVGELIAERDQAVKLRDEYLAILAHELRNPLMPLRNAVYLMRRSEIADPLLARTAGIIDRQVSHIVRLLDDLMDVARLERGKVSLQKRLVDLNQVVDGALQSSAEAAAAKGHRLEARPAAQPVPVEADPVRLDQVVCNLVHNAIKFSPEPATISVATSIEGRFAVLAVEDRGVGFQPSLRETLFDPFLQLNPTLERSAGGLGMGLTIVKRLVELHGGSVDAESEGPGKGARFIVKLPASSMPAEAAAEAEPAAPRAHRLRIVLIEDNADIRETVSILATLWGHEVATAADGPSGLELVLEKRPDVALIDIGLPGMNGYDVARAIREAASEPIRLVAVTGYGQPADRERAAAAGFDAHLLKPIAPEVLRDLLAD